MRRIVVLVQFLTAAALVALCATAMVAQSAPTEAAPKDPLPEDAGKDTVLRVCGGCHDIETAVSTRGNEKEWREIVELMIERGATGTDEDFRTVVAYLAKHFGAKR